MRVLLLLIIIVTTSSLSTIFDDLCRCADNTFLRQAFEGEYPKLLRLYSDLWRRLQHFLADLVDTGVSLVDTEPTDSLSLVAEEEDKDFEYVTIIM